MSGFVSKENLIRWFFSILKPGDVSFLNKVKDKEKVQAIYKHFEWLYEASEDKWLNSRNEVNLQIETTYHAKEKICLVKDRTDTEYVIEITDTKNLRSGDWIKEKEVRFNLFV